MDDVLDGGDGASPCVLTASASTIMAGMAMPIAQPSRKDGPFTLALDENSVRITVITGTGLIAMPKA